VKTKKEWKGESEVKKKVENVGFAETKTLKKRWNDARTKIMKTKWASVKIKRAIEACPRRASLGSGRWWRLAVVSPPLPIAGLPRQFVWLVL